MGAAFQATVICLILLHGCNAAAQDDEWKSATATYSKETDGSIIIEGACGYGDLHRSSYGKYSAGLSSMLFNRGSTCGSCFEVRCVDHILWCLQGSPSVTLTATDFCPPNYGLPADYGGWCNFPRAHFEMSKAAFAEIAEKRADIVPVQYRRVKCERSGAIRFTVYGTSFYYQVLITNVGSDGEVVGVKVKGSKTGWIPMGRNWGQNWQCNLNLSGQPLSFEVTTSTGRTVTSYNVAPPTCPVPRNKNEWSAKVPPTNFRAAMSPASTTEAVPCISLLNTRMSCTIFRQRLKCIVVYKIFKLIEDLEREEWQSLSKSVKSVKGCFCLTKPDYWGYMCLP